jgi:hypothetical protein
MPATLERGPLLRCTVRSDFGGRMRLDSGASGPSSVRYPHQFCVQCDLCHLSEEGSGLGWYPHAEVEILMLWLQALLLYWKRWNEVL